MPKQTKKRAVKGARFVGYRVVKGASLPSATTITRRYHTAHDLYDSSSNEDTDEESFWLQSKRTFTKQPPPPPSPPSQEIGGPTNNNSNNKGDSTTAATATGIAAAPAAVVDSNAAFNDRVGSSADPNNHKVEESEISYHSAREQNVDDEEEDDDRIVLYADNNSNIETPASVENTVSSDARKEDNSCLGQVDARRRAPSQFLNRNSDGATKVKSEEGSTTIIRSSPDAIVSMSSSSPTPNHSSSSSSSRSLIKIEATIQDADHVDDNRHNNSNTTASKNNAATVERKNGKEDGGCQVASSTLNKCRSANEKEEKKEEEDANYDRNATEIGIEAKKAKARTERSVEANIERRRKRKPSIARRSSSKRKQKQKLIATCADGTSQDTSSQSWSKIWKYLNLGLGWKFDYPSEKDCLKHGSSIIWLRPGFTKHHRGILGIDHFFTEDDVMEYCTKNGINIQRLNSSTLSIESENNKNNNKSGQHMNECNKMNGVQLIDDFATAGTSITQSATSVNKDSNKNRAIKVNKRPIDMSSSGLSLNDNTKKKIMSPRNALQIGVACTPQHNLKLNEACNDENLKIYDSEMELNPWTIFNEIKTDHKVCLEAGIIFREQSCCYYLPGEDTKRFYDRFRNPKEVVQYLSRTNGYPFAASSGSQDKPTNNIVMSFVRLIRYAFVPGSQRSWMDIRKINRSETAYLLHKLGYRRTDNDRCWETPNSFVKANILEPKYDSLELLCDALRCIDDIYIPQNGGKPKRCKLPVTQTQIMALRLRIAEGFTEFDEDYIDKDYEGYVFGTYNIGTRMKKYFDTQYAWYEGSIISYSPESHLYTIKYDDGDTEELEHHEINTDLFSKRPMYELGLQFKRSFVSRQTGSDCGWSTGTIKMRFYYNSSANRKFNRWRWRYRVEYTDDGGTEDLDEIEIEESIESMKHSKRGRTLTTKKQSTSQISTNSGIKSVEITEQEWAEICDSIAAQIDDEKNSGKIDDITNEDMNVTTKYPKGVYKGRSRTNPYVAGIKFRGKNRHIGCWDTLECAVRAHMLAKAIFKDRIGGIKKDDITETELFEIRASIEAQIEDEKNSGKIAAATAEAMNSTTKYPKGVRLTKSQLNPYAANIYNGRCRYIGCWNTVQYAARACMLAEEMLRKLEQEKQKNSKGNNENVTTKTSASAVSKGLKQAKTNQNNSVRATYTNKKKKKVTNGVRICHSQQQQHTIVTKAATSFTFADRICRVEEAMLGATTHNNNSNGGGGYINRIHNLESQIFAPDYQVPTDLVRRLEALEQFL